MFIEKLKLKIHARSYYGKIYTGLGINKRNQLKRSIIC